MQTPRFPARASLVAVLAAAVLAPESHGTPTPLPAATAPAIPPLLANAPAGPDDASERLAYIDGLNNRDLHALVVTEAEQFLAEHPNHAEAPTARWRLASALFALDRLDEARPQFARLASDSAFAQRAEANLRLGQCELQTGSAERAVAPLTAVRQLGDAYLHEPATFLLAEAWFGAGDHERALPLYDEVLARWPDGPYARDAGVARTWCLQRSQRFDDAVAQASALLVSGVPHELGVELHFVRAEAHAEADRPAQALADYRRVGDGPFADAALRGTGFAAASLGDHQSASEAFATLLSEYPSSRFAPEAAFQLGVQQLQAGNAADAWQTLSSRAIEVSAETRYWQARARGDMGYTDEALSLLAAASALRPSAEMAAHISTARGDLLTRAGRSAEAADAYAASGSTSALHAAAVASLNGGDATAALELAERVLASGDVSPDVQLTHAEALFALQRHDEARPAYERAAAGGDPARTARARSRIAWCDHLTGDDTAAAAGFGLVLRDHRSAPEAAEAQFMQGRCLDRIGDTVGATASWRGYLQAHPNGAHANESRLGLARLLPPNEAIAPLRAVTRSDATPEQTAVAHHALAEAYVALARDQEAATEYATLIQQYPASPLVPTARYGLAWLAVDGGAPDEALTLIAPLLRTPRRNEPAVDADLVTAALELAVWCRHELGDGPGAEAALDQLAARNVAPERLLASARTVAAVYSNTGHDAQATAVLDRVAASNPGALVESAWIALDAGNLNQADARARAAEQAAPADGPTTELAFFVGEAWFEQGNDEAAVAHYAAAVASARLADQALYKMGFAHLRNEDPRAARPCFDEVVSEHGNSPLLGESLFLAGEASFRLGEFDQAASRLARFVDELPGHELSGKARFRLGLSRAQLEQWREASEVLGDLARRHPGFENLVEAELWRGRALAQLGNDRAARSAFDRVVAEDRGQLAARARLELGRLHMTGGETEAALSEFLKVAVLYDHDDEVGQALLLAGDCLTQLGQPDAAVARYRELLDRTPQGTHADEARRRLGGV